MKNIELYNKESPGSKKDWEKAIKEAVVFPIVPKHEVIPKDLKVREEEGKFKKEIDQIKKIAPEFLNSETSFHIKSSEGNRLYVTPNKNKILFISTNIDNYIIKHSFSKKEFKAILNSMEEL